MARIPMTASSRRSKRGARSGRRNGWSAKWSDQLKLKEGETAWVMLTPGSYRTLTGDQAPWLELAMYKVQYVNKWGNQSWSYFQGQRRGDCTLAARADCGDNRVTAPRDREEPNRFFMNLIHLDLFRREQVMDKTGEPMRYRGGKLKGEIVYSWKPVTSIRERKDIVKSGDFEDCTFFRKKFVELPFTHFESLKEIARTARSMCNCGGSLVPAVFSCEKCEEILLDVEDTDLSEAEVRRFGNNNIRCNSCGHVGFPKEDSICDSCEDPTPASPWMVAAQITKVRDGQWPTIRVLKVVPLSEYKFPDGTSPLDSDGALIEDLKKVASVQFDLEEYAAPRETSYYSEILQLTEHDIGFAADSKDYGRFR